MVKSLNELRQQKAKLLDLKAPPESTKPNRDFVAKHVVVLHPDPAGNDDGVFKAKGVKRSKRAPDHGYEPGKDEEVYEDAYKELELRKADVRAAHSAGLSAERNILSDPEWKKEPGHWAHAKELSTKGKDPKLRNILRGSAAVTKERRARTKAGLTNSYEPEGLNITESKALLDRATSAAEEHDGGLILTHKVTSKSGLTTTRQYQHVGHDEKGSHWFPLGDHDHHLDAFSADPKKSYKTISHKELGSMMDNGAQLHVLHHHHREDEDEGLHISSDDYKTGATMRLNANGNTTGKTKKVTRSDRTGIYSSYEPQGNKLDEIFGKKTLKLGGTEAQGYEHIGELSESDQSLLVDTYNSLNEANQDHFLELIETQEGVDEILDFAITNKGFR